MFYIRFSAKKKYESLSTLFKSYSNVSLKNVYVRQKYYRLYIREIKYISFHLRKFKTKKKKDQHIHCMIFDKTGRLIRKRSNIKGIDIENVTSYKYLEFFCDTIRGTEYGLQDFRHRALKSFFKLKTMLLNTFRQGIATTLSLIDALINPI